MELAGVEQAGSTDHMPDGILCIEQDLCCRHGEQCHRFATPGDAKVNVIAAQFELAQQ